MHAVLFLSVLQFFRRRGARLRGSVHQLHEGATGHRRCEGVEASERTVPGLSGAHQTAQRAELSWSTTARYRIGSGRFTHGTGCMFAVCFWRVFPTMTQVNLLSSCSSSLWSLETSQVASQTLRSFWTYSHLTNMCRLAPDAMHIFHIYIYLGLTKLTC